jgi:hypothetical protein
MTALNFGLKRVINPLENISGVLHVVFFIIIVAVLTSTTSHRSTEFVFKTLRAESGWSNPGIAWSIGLLTTAYPISSFDSVLHMSTVVPKYFAARLY